MRLARVSTSDGFGVCGSAFSSSLRERKVNWFDQRAGDWMVGASTVSSSRPFTTADATVSTCTGGIVSALAIELNADSSISFGSPLREARDDEEESARSTFAGVGIEELGGTELCKFSDTSSKAAGSVLNGRRWE